MWIDFAEGVLFWALVIVLNLIQILGPTNFYRSVKRQCFSFCVVPYNILHFYKQVKQGGALVAVC
jgi:hypothetical protein